MGNLNTVEIKAFVPAKDYERSKAFYQDMGFTQASDTQGVAYFHHGNCSFLLQDFYEEKLANNLMMHLLVEDAKAWHQQLQEKGIVEKYDVLLGDIEEQPWGMLDFVIKDPSGVLWRVGQNI
ncbi:VOC family protein [Maricurvus nonylphenolicus]|uniref:VOC family protein n=1 Tax=Maricurvus nonylphenolicus TaxID=1008307 RepID=UPI0036F4040E